MPKNVDPNLLVGFETSDDAGVYRLTDELALVTTADIITPPVDDPYAFGRIAAANSLSDVYAMGGRPLTCINLVGFPSAELGPEILEGMVAGALEKITEAGAVLAGGHTTEDEEPKFGLAVTGVVHPKRYWSNSGARVGDALVLTKPIGSGVLFNANLKGSVSEDALAECIEVITTLNRRAAEVAAGYEIHAATDITGFGLAGHASEMARGSGLTLEIAAARVPTMKEALAMYEKGVSTGVNAENRANVEPFTRFDADLPQWHREIFVDPQTSGGLLLATPADGADELVAALQEAGVAAACRIGEVRPLADETYLVFS